MAPCITSCCGLSLQKSVIVVGIIELAITVIATALNVTKAAGGFDGYGQDCEGKDVCIGPIIKYAVFDSVFGIVCSLLLIFGAHTRNSCMLIGWMVVTVILSAKYIWVVVTHDWTSLEDWISITYLVFYVAVYVVVVALMQEVTTLPAFRPVGLRSPTAGYIHTGQGAVVITTQTIPMQQQQGYPQQQQGFPQQPYAVPQQPYALPPPQPQYPPYGPPPPQAYVQQPPSAPGY